MDRTQTYRPDPEDPFADLFQRGMRIARRLGISFALSAVAAIVVGAAATDNWFVQLLITAFATIAFWPPLFFLVAWTERLFSRGPAQAHGVASSNSAGTTETDRIWRRLVAAAPHHAERIAVLQRSIDRSRTSLGRSKMDVDAHEVCALIDRRLPELIERDLDDLPPDDRGRKRQIEELIDLIEQFARDCSRRNASNAPADRYGAEVLRRRFEAHLSSFGPNG
jgi:hypothetical protein